MYISQETASQTHARLRKVIAEAELLVYDQPYVFEEISVERFPTEHLGDALAFVRDSEVWSALVPQRRQQQEAFFVFSFHFPPNLDNSGFVGWLASHLKASVGTGVFVVCGQNSKRGGIFDYWGAPLSVGDKVIKEVKLLRGRQSDVST
ncbi:MAG TPA: DUF6196 family protein [Gemmatimonadaceae bacterium]|nr:DUF6196 family protein [Gemmatimonadaceae bacterium]